MSLPAAALPNAMSTPGGLNRQQKATIIVRLLQSEGVELSLADLPDDLQIALAEEMSAMRYVNRSTLQSVVSEFVEELGDLGLTFPRSVPRAIDALTPSLSESATLRLRQAAGVDAPDNPWEWISEHPVEKLIPLIGDESVEVAAVALSKLTVTKAAEILGMLPGEQARKIAFTMSRTADVSPQVVQRIGEAMVSELQSEPPKAFAAAPANRVGSILNYARSATREDVLESLYSEDQEFGEAVRKAIFTFKDIRTRIDPRDVPKIVRDTDGLTLAKAFAAAAQAEEDVAAMEFMLENMSQRVAAQLREEADGIGKIKEKDGEAAMNEVISAIRLLAETGEITYRDEDEAAD
ncbi:MAG: FliG C-terminal domain-containing protein [Pseudomonadota bacterium]